MDAAPRAWEGKTGGGKWGKRFLFSFLGMINVTILYPLLIVIVPFYMLFGRKKCRAIFRYFKNSYQMSSAKALWNTFVNYLIFAQIVVDKFAAIAGRVKNFTIETSTNDYVKTLLAQKKGFIIASSHIGNFELGGYVFQQDKRELYALVYGGESQEYLQKREAALKNVKIHFVTVQEDMSHLFLLKQVLEEGNIVTIPCDRVFGSKKTIEIPFLGRDAAFPLGPFRFAAQLDVPIVALFVMKEHLTKYKAYIIPIESDNEAKNSITKSEQLAKSFAQSCEEILRKYPHQWFNYFDFWGKE